MVMTKMDLMLFRMIKNSKSQFLAVLVIILAGISIYTSMGMVSDNLYETVNTYYDESNFPHLFIEVQGVPASELDRLKQIQGVSQVTGSLVIDVPLLAIGSGFNGDKSHGGYYNEISADSSSAGNNTGQNHKTLRLITVKEDPDQNPAQATGLSLSTLQSGTFFTSEGNRAGGSLAGSRTNKEILLMGQFAKANKILPGDQISVQLLGLNHKLKVVGTVANPEYIYMVENIQSIMPDDSNFGVGFIDEAAGRLIMGESQNYNYIRVEFEPYAHEKTVIDALENRLKPYGLQSIIERENQLSNAVVQEELKSIKMLANYLPWLFLITAGFILMMILSRIVKNDRLKIGVLKAMGYDNRQILFHYTKYAVIVGLLGGSLGAVIGMALANAMTGLFLEYFHIPLLEFHLDFSYLFSAMLVTAVFCILSGLLGARSVLKISPADAMQEEAPKSGKRILLEALTPLWKRLSFSSKLVMKNIFRNKKRTVFVISGVMVTYALMMFTSTMPDVVDQMMNRHFTEFQKMDYNISFHKPTGQEALRDLAQIIDIDYAEGKIDFPFELSRGNRSQAVNIIGLAENTEFYSFTDAKGKPVTLDSAGLLLSENLALALDVGKGDLIQVKSYLPHKEEISLPVSAVIKQTLGMNAYMEIGAMQETLLEKGLITGVLAYSKDGAVSSKLLQATNVATIMSIKDMRSVYEKYLNMIDTSIGFMVVFSGIIGFCVVYIATMVSINEREGEFSSLRVLGFTKAEIFKMIRNENNIITLAGIILGIPLGKLFCDYGSLAFTTDIYALDLSPTLGAGLWSGLLTLIFVVFAQLATYIKIHKLDFLQALKNRTG